jgi:hypothetical protein
MSQNVQRCEANQPGPLGTEMIEKKRRFAKEAPGWENWGVSLGFCLATTRGRLAALVATQ